MEPSEEYKQIIETYIFHVRYFTGIGMKSVLIIGTLLSQAEQEFYFQNGIRPAAAGIAQRYMVRGLSEARYYQTIDVIGAVRLTVPYPKSSIKRALGLEETFENGKIVGIAFPNRPLIGFIIRRNRLKKEAVAWATAHSNNDVTVFVYSMHSPFLEASKQIKRIIPSAKIVLIVADLPLFMDMRGTLRRIFKFIDWYRIRKLMSSVDKYLLYTKYMADYLRLPDNKWIVFEGLIDSSRIPTNNDNKLKGNVCLYAGNLNAEYGIDMLIEAFGKIKSDAKLFIYGAGFDLERIKRLVIGKRNVEFKGLVTSDEAFNIMKKATLLINPRPKGLELAKYSCPSKTLEYMVSGTPVLMTRLPGLPTEYYPYVYFFEDESVEGFTSKIDEVLSYSSEVLKNKGKSAAEFLLKQKNNFIQMGRVIRFVEKAE